MSIERLCQELNIVIPPDDWAGFKYTWAGKTTVRLGACTNGSVFWISSWGGLMFRSPNHIPHSMLRYDTMKESFLKYIALLKPGEIPALDHLIPELGLARSPEIYSSREELAEAECEEAIKDDDPESIPVIPSCLKSGPTHDWIGALYRPYVPIA